MGRVQKEIRKRKSEYSRDIRNIGSMMIHQPVLLNEVLQYLDPKPNENFIDATVGGGGHAFKILKQTKPNGKLLGIDLWEEVIKELKIKRQKLGLDNRLILVNDNFVNLVKIIKKYNFFPVQGVLLDLGLSSDILERSKRGFSFQKDEYLDMRYNLGTSLTAQEIVNKYSKEELTKIFFQFGQERFSRLIAQAIINNRSEKEIRTTQELSNLIKNVLKNRFHIKSLARIFQALRIFVNNELENLELTLKDIPDILSPNGKIVVISYHSLEDRIVKFFFKNHKELKIMTKKPITPSEEEIRNNSRSRSAKLRCAYLG